jgi:LPXTG-motif cell wall-anchored protein
MKEERMSSTHQLRLARILVVLAITALGLAGRGALAAPEAQASATVEMQDFVFAPKTITIAAGTTVNWPNTGQAPHTSTSDTGLWDSGQKAAGESFSFTFREAGTFPYYCTLHGTPGGVGMAGTVIVTAAQAPAPAATRAPAPAAPTATIARTVPAVPTMATAPAAQAPAPRATTAPAAGGSGETPAPLPRTGQSSATILLLGIATLALGGGLLLRWNARRRTDSSR